MSNYDALNQPLKIGGITIKNRYIVAPVSGGAFYTEDGGYNDTTINYFVQRAKGGFGLIIPGAICPDSKVDPYNATGINPLDTPAAFKETSLRMSEQIQAEGAKIFSQISLGLGRNYPGLFAPSELPVYNTPDQVSPALTTEQLKTKIALVIEMSKLAKESGYDGIEVHAMHWGYLLDQLGMSLTNKRTDEYGGPLENRLRAAREIVEGIKAECGSDYPVSMRLALQTFVKDFDKATLTGEEEAGRTLAEGIEISKLLESYGYDTLNVDVGIYDSFYYACPPMYMPQGFMNDLAAAAKKEVNIPIICGGRMNNPDDALKGVENGAFDAVALGRPSLAEPEYPNKLFAGHKEKIRPCIGCNLGCWNRLLAEGKPASCAVNPAAMRELDYGLETVTEKKTVAVIGGGVGGMEAARAAAQRGYDVTIYEKSNKLGGHLLEAGAHSFKKEVLQLNAWYENELKELEVEIELNKEMTADKIKNLGANEVILATGSVAVNPPIPGLDKSNVLISLEAINNPGQIKENVVVIGGGLVGCEIALDCAKEGKKVTIVEALDSILAAGMPAPKPNKQMLGDLFEYYQVQILTSHKLKAVTDTGVLLETAGKEVELPADTVISALGFKPGKSMAEELRAQGINAYIIGDAKEAKTIMNAIWEGYDVARAL